MAVEAMQPPGMVNPDPDINMGLALEAERRRAKMIHTAQVTLVWIVLIIILGLVLWLLKFDAKYAIQHAPFVLEGAITFTAKFIETTIFLSLVSILFATIMALLGAIARLSQNPVAQGLSGFYVSLFRGTPLLIQIFIIYLGLPQIGAALRQLGYPQLGDMFILKAWQSGVLALSLNYGAYMTEIFRAGIQSIAYGQNEAAVALGMSRWQTMVRVILPQAIRIIIPDIGNQFIAMQKDTAQVSVMGIWEITFRANRLARQESKFLEMFLVAAAVYWILTIISSWLESRLERRLAHAYER